MSAPMFLAVQIGAWLFYALQIVAFGLELWALAEAARTPAQAYERTGGRTKGFWLVLTGVAAAVGLLGLLAGPTPAGIGMFGLIAVCVATVFLAGPRDDLRFHSGRR